MSLAIPGNEGTTCLSTGSSLTSSRLVATAGFTTTTPATRSGWSAARRSTRAPPMERPATTTASFSALSFSNARVSSPYQSAHAVLFRSCHRVP